MLALVAAVALAQADGAVGFYEDVQGLVFGPADGGVFGADGLKLADARGVEPEAGWVELGPGCFASTAVCIEKGKRAADREAELEQLRGAPHDFSFGEVFKAAWVGFGLGALSALVGIGTACWALTGSVICQR
jgi:hypothetical protein